jgi:type I restriction enzyme M protein
LGNDIPDIVTQWKKRGEMKNSDRSAKCFFVPRKEIEDNEYDLSINRYKEVLYEMVKYEEPSVILGKIEKLEDEITSGLQVLKKMQP